MAIRWVCSACGKKLQADDSLAGKVGKCPQCGVPVRVPLLTPSPVIPPAAARETPAVARPEPATKSTLSTTPPESEPAISLITIRGKPKWVLATLAAGLLTGLLPYLLRPQQDTINADAPTEVVAVEPAPARPVSRTPIRPPKTPPSTPRSAARPRLPSKPTTEAQRPPSPPVVAAAGLGISLTDVERIFPAEQGWYWESKERNELGVGISYMAANTKTPDIKFVVTGEISNLERFTAVVNICSVQDDQERFVLYLVRQEIPLKMVKRVCRSSLEPLEKWYLGALKASYQDDAPSNFYADTKMEGVGVLLSTREYAVGHGPQNCTQSGRWICLTIQPSAKPNR